MAEQARLDVLVLERVLEPRVVLEINLPNGQVIGGSPIGVHFVEQIRGEAGWH